MEVGYSWDGNSIGVGQIKCITQDLMLDKIWSVDLYVLFIYSFIYLYIIYIFLFIWMYICVKKKTWMYKNRGSYVIYNLFVQKLNESWLDKAQNQPTSFA